MLWLVYFLGHYFLLRGGGIVHKRFEPNLVPKIELLRWEQVGTTDPRKWASEGQIGPLRDVVDTSERRGGHE